MIRQGLSLFCLLIFVTEANADVFRPAYLELRELGGDRYAVLWKVPAQGTGLRLAAYVRMPPGTEDLTEPRITNVHGARIERWQIHHAGGLIGKTIWIDGKAAGVTEVIARHERQNGTSQVERLTVERPAFKIKAPQGMAAVALSYFLIGVEHILRGVDHLLFIFALILIVKGTGQLIATVTAFTVAHSVTLAAATLGWVHVPGPPVEAMIALSIVFVSAEFVRAQAGRPVLTGRAPWIVSFSFGLLHGFGFAGALAEVGLPDNAIPLALLAFNVGVEAGQLLFVGAFILLQAAGARQLLTRSPRLPWAAAYAVGAIAAYWTIDRVTAFWA